MNNNSFTNLPTPTINSVPREQTNEDGANANYQQDTTQQGAQGFGSMLQPEVGVGSTQLCPDQVNVDKNSNQFNHSKVFTLPPPPYEATNPTIQEFSHQAPMPGSQMANQSNQFNQHNYNRQMYTTTTESAQQGSNHIQQQQDTNQFHAVHQSGNIMQFNPQHQHVETARLHPHTHQHNENQQQVNGQIYQQNYLQATPHNEQQQMFTSQQQHINHQVPQQSVAGSSRYIRPQFVNHQQSPATVFNPSSCVQMNNQYVHPQSTRAQTPCQAVPNTPSRQQIPNQSVVHHSQINSSSQYVRAPGQQLNSPSPHLHQQANQHTTNPEMLRQSETPNQTITNQQINPPSQFVRAQTPNQQLNSPSIRSSPHLHQQVNQQPTNPEVLRQQVPQTLCQAVTSHPQSTRAQAPCQTIINQQTNTPLRQQMPNQYAVHHSQMNPPSIMQQPSQQQQRTSVANFHFPATSIYQPTQSCVAGNTATMEANHKYQSPNTMMHPSQINIGKQCNQQSVVSRTLNFGSQSYICPPFPSSQQVGQPTFTPNVPGPSTIPQCVQQQHCKVAASPNYQFISRPTATIHHRPRPLQNLHHQMQGNRTLPSQTIHGNLQRECRKASTSKSKMNHPPAVASRKRNRKKIAPIIQKFDIPQPPPALDNAQFSPYHICTQRFLELINRCDMRNQMWNISAQSLNELLVRYYSEHPDELFNLPYTTTMVMIRQACSDFVRANCSTNYNIIQDEPFRQANEMYHRKISRYVSQYQSKVPTLLFEDAVRIYESNVLSYTRPGSLVRKVWFDLTIHLAKRGFQSSMNWATEDFTAEVELNGRKYISLAHHSAVNGSMEIRVYDKPGCIDCPVSSFLFLKSKLGQRSQPLLQKAATTQATKGRSWYTGKALSNYAISKLMPEISECAQLTRVYTVDDLRNTVTHLGIEIFAIARERATVIYNSRVVRPPFASFNQPSATQHPSMTPKPRMEATAPNMMSQVLTSQVHPHVMTPQVNTQHRPQVNIVQPLRYTCMPNNPSRLPNTQEPVDPTNNVKASVNGIYPRVIQQPYLNKSPPGKVVQERRVVEEKFRPYNGQQQAHIRVFPHQPTQQYFNQTTTSTYQNGPPQTTIDASALHHQIPSTTLGGVVNTEQGVADTPVQPIQKEAKSQSNQPPCSNAQVEKNLPLPWMQSSSLTDLLLDSSHLQPKQPTAITNNNNGEIDEINDAINAHDKRVASQTEDNDDMDHKDLIASLLSEPTLDNDLQANNESTAACNKNDNTNFESSSLFTTMLNDFPDTEAQGLADFDDQYLLYDQTL